MDIESPSDPVRPDHDKNEGQPNEKQILQDRLKSAIEQDDAVQLKQILAQDKQLVASTFRYQYDKDKPDMQAPILPLLYAAKLGRDIIVGILLLEHGADINARLDGSGKTSLHHAAEHGWLATVELLVSHRPDINQADVKGWTALHYACRGGHTKVASCLLENQANFEQQTTEKETPFTLACICGDLELLQLLWDLGPKTVIGATDTNADQPLHKAAAHNNHKAVTWLLGRNADIEAKGIGGFTPLCQAILGRSYEAAQVLLDDGANVHAGDNCQKATPILMASHMLDPKLTELLAQYGASFLDEDKKGHNCFHHAVTSERRSEEDFTVLVGLLLSGGADINHLSRGDFSPLATACIQGWTAEAYHLLDFGADINQAGLSSGVTALAAACSRPNNTDVISLLLRRRADMTKANVHGTSPLAVACFNGHAENVELLISRGCEIAPRNRLGHTPLHHTVEKGHFDIGLQLLKTPVYFPSNPDQWVPTEPASEVEDIGAGLLKELQKRSGIPLEDLQAITYWAVTNGHQALAEECIKADEQILRMERGGATLLYTAAQYARPKMIPILSRASVFEIAANQRTAMHWAAMRGMREAAEELFRLVEKGGAIQVARAKVNLIMQRDGLGCTALALSIKNRGKALTTAPTDLFLDEMKHLGTVDKDFLTSHNSQAVEILEILAELEKPGNEQTLRYLLIEWHQLQHTPETTTLELAVRSSKATVVWWLLSNGAYLSRRHITDALKSLPVDKPSDVQRKIRKLLENPPTTLKHVANPNDDRPPKLPDIRDAPSDSFGVEGMIVDIYADGRSAHTQSSIKKIIYDDGPNRIMSDEALHPQQRFREFKNSLQPLENPIPGKAFTPDQPTANQLFRWIHLPVAEIQLMRALACRISHDSNISEMNHELMMQHFNLSWTELAAGGGKYYMKPRCTIKEPNQQSKGSNGGQKQEKRANYMALYTPYLNFGPYQVDTSTHSHREDAQFEGTYEPIQSRRSRQVTHERMTLDQYYYSVLDETNARDGDQVLSKFVDFWSKEKLVAKYQDNTPIATEGRQKTLVVDQLWVWVLDEKTIITATTEAQEEMGGVLLRNLKKNLLGNETESGFERPSSIHMFVEQILGITTGFFEWPVIRSKTPLDVFRESIRFVVNNETDLFNIFRNALETERENQDGSSKQPGHAVKLMPPNPYHIIASETTLLDIIRDIRDELRILSCLADDQEDVWKRAINTYTTNRTLQYYHVYTPSDVKEDLEALLGEAEMVYDSINLLLDLRQKQASIKEAEFGRIQANDSARQSNSIFIFTVITIIFLPLSFLSSLFALDVSSFPHESGDLKYQGWWLFPILFGVTAIVSIPTIMLAWKINAISNWWRRKEAPVVSHQGLPVGRTEDVREFRSIRSRFRRPTRRVNPV